MGVPFVGADDLRSLLPMPEAIAALEASFGADERPEAPLRSNLDTPAGSLLVMPAIGPQGVGVKLVTLTPANRERGLPFIHAAYLLFDAAAQSPRAILDGAALTALRTGAVSGVATRRMAVEGATRLLIFGAGVQARSHLEAMRAVRPVDELVVISATMERARSLVREATTVGLRARVGTSEDVGWAQLVCTCTTSAVPVLEGARLAPGAHVNAIGAYTRATREVDTDGVRRARVVVETREAAMAEAGDLLIAMGEGAIGPEHIVADLTEVVKGVPVRISADDVTLFKSVGVAFEDLVVAAAVAERL